MIFTWLIYIYYIQYTHTHTLFTEKDIDIVDKSKGKINHTVQPEPPFYHSIKKWSKWLVRTALKWVHTADRWSRIPGRRSDLVSLKLHFTQVWAMHYSAKRRERCRVPESPVVFTCVKLWEENVHSEWIHWEEWLSDADDFASSLAARQLNHSLNMFERVSEQRFSTIAFLSSYTRYTADVWIGLCQIIMICAFL